MANATVLETEKSGRRQLGAFNGAADIADGADLLTGWVRR